VRTGCSTARMCAHACTLFLYASVSFAGLLAACRGVLLGAARGVASPRAAVRARLRRGAARWETPSCVRRVVPFHLLTGPSQLVRPFASPSLPAADNATPAARRSTAGVADAAAGSARAASSRVLSACGGQAHPRCDTRPLAPQRPDGGRRGRQLRLRPVRDVARGAAQRSAHAPLAPFPQNSGRCTASPRRTPLGASEVRARRTETARLHTALRAAPRCALLCVRVRARTVRTAAAAAAAAAGAR
jgi:hypothetical protein